MTPTTPSLDIEALALKAIKARKAACENTDPDQVGRLGMALSVASHTFKDEATPEAWLTLISEKRALEAFRERVARLSLRESNGMRDAAVNSIHDAADVVRAARALTPSHGEKT